MSSSTQPLIAVVGGLGAQGGSVVKFLLSSGAFRVRALTRNPESEKAKALKDKGVEVMSANIDEPATLETAFAGVYGVFGVTNFWEHMDFDREVQQGKNLIDAAQKVGVKHFVWSTLDHTPVVYVPHWESKARVDDYLKESGLPRTSLYTAFYYDNMISIPLGIKRDGDRLVVDWPLIVTDGPVGMYDVADTGAYVAEAFLKPDEWIGKDLRICADIVTARDFVNTVHDVTGQTLELVETDEARFDASQSFQPELYANMKYFYDIFKVDPKRDLVLTERLFPERKNLRRWVESKKEHLLSL